jgi:hypothetical protein
MLRSAAASGRSWTFAAGAAGRRPFQVMEDLPGDPGYSTVRTQLRVLEGKGHVRHEKQGLRYV